MIFRFHNGRVALPTGAVGAADIAIADGAILSVTPAADTPADQVVDLRGGWLLPGFVDTQVNGGGGVLFNDQVDVDAIAAIGAAHARFGTTAFLPTLISDTPAQIASAQPQSTLRLNRACPASSAPISKVRLSTR